MCVVEAQSHTGNLAGSLYPTGRKHASEGIVGLSHEIIPSSGVGELSSAQKVTSAPSGAPRVPLGASITRMDSSGTAANA